jgi:uncharacterized protein (TIGR03437 family)
MRFRHIAMAAGAGLLPAAILYGFSSGPLPGLTGAPGESTCAQCHGGGQVNVGGGSIQLNLTNFTRGATQRVVITISDPQARRWGFEASVRQASDNSTAGTLQPADGSSQTLSAGSHQYIEQTSAGTRPGATGSVTFEFDWTAPDKDDPVVFYVAANAANGNGSPDSGDHIYKASFPLSVAASGGPAPALAATNPVDNAGSFAPGMTPGAWVAIFGSNMAATTRTFRTDEIVNGVLPTQLDGVSVTINNKPAAIHFISPGQLNVQVPDDNGAGPVEVKVKTADGSATTTATLQPAAPGFFMYDPDSRKYLAAQHADFSIVGRAGLFPNATSTPARPGEIVVLYGTGFGPTNPATPAGVLVTTPAEIDKSQLTVLVGNTQAQALFAGVVQAGLWQLNVQLPDNLPDGDVPVVATVNGVRTQDNAFLTIQR